jgi:hypothetical protein
MDYSLSEAQLKQYHDDGYVVLRGAIPLANVESQKTAVNALIDRSIADGRPEIPWINKEKRLPERLGLLLRPECIHPAFVESIEAGPFLPIAAQLLGVPVRYSLFGMLAGGDGKPYIQGWHRDLAPIGEPDEEAVVRGGYQVYTQINAPLFADRYVTIVPGSHLRASTSEELQVLKNDPTGDMPGQMTVEMEPGDVVFYYSNLWHRGFNPEGNLRWTMHHAFVRAGAPVCVHEKGQESWLRDAAYLDTLPPRTRSFMQGYLDAVSDEAPSFFDVAKKFYEKSLQ